MAILTRRRNGNGNNPMDTPFDGSSQSDIERVFSQADMPSVIKEFVHPGKTPQDLLMRTVFRNENQRNAALRYLRKCEKFRMASHIIMLTNWLAASPSVEGRSRKEVLQATAGIIVPSLYSDARQERYRNDKRNNGDDSDRR